MSNDVQICFVVRGGTMTFICGFRYEWNMNDLFFLTLSDICLLWFWKWFLMGLDMFFVFDMVVDNYGLWIWF